MLKESLFPWNWNRSQEDFFLVSPNQNVPEAHAQSKDASQDCIKRGQKTNQRVESKSTHFFSKFFKILFLFVFSLFDSFLLILALENSKVLVQAWTLRILLRKALKNERENFGLQQLPLFKLLTPEEWDWQACHSWLEGGRWLNTKVPRNLHSMIC